MGGVLFSSAAVATLAYWQAANMPDRAFVFVRSMTRHPGGVIVESWTFDRVEPCRLSLSRAIERDTGGALAESPQWTVARPADMKRLDGTERLLIVSHDGRNPSIVVRVAGVQGPRTFQTVQKADVTTVGVDPLVIATRRNGAPALVGMTTRATVTVGDV